MRRRARSRSALRRRFSEVAFERWEVHARSSRAAVFNCARSVAARCRHSSRSTARLEDWASCTSTSRSLARVASSFRASASACACHCARSVASSCRCLQRSERRSLAAASSVRACESEADVQAKANRVLGAPRRDGSASRCDQCCQRSSAAAAARRSAPSHTQRSRCSKRCWRR